MDTKRKILLWSSFTGAIIGYFLFHPLVMLLSFLMSVRDHALDMANMTSVIAVLRRSFSMDMLPWSLSFSLFNCIIGLYYGITKVEKIAREELIENLQKALADVKTLSGMLPICAWCKNIRNDEGYWQKIEAYLKSHSDLDFTHSICSDCAKKEFPELISDSDKSNTK
jgi:hypothetical protein